MAVEPLEMKSGAVSGALTDVGINDKFMKEVANTMNLGSSALFVLVRKSTPDNVLEDVIGTGGKIIKTCLSHGDETKLEAALNAAKQQAGGGWNSAAPT